MADHIGSIEQLDRPPTRGPIDCSQGWLVRGADGESRLTSVEADEATGVEVDVRIEKRIMNKRDTKAPTASKLWRYVRKSESHF